MRRLAVDDDLGSARPGVVVGAHAHRIGTGREQREQVAFAERQLAVEREKVGALANRTDDLPETLWLAAWLHGTDFVPGIIESRAKQIVHRRIDDGEASLLTGLEVGHSRER